MPQWILEDVIPVEDNSSVHSNAVEKTTNMLFHSFCAEHTREGFNQPNTGC